MRAANGIRSGILSRCRGRGTAPIHSCILAAALLPMGATRGFAAGLLEEYTARRWTDEEGLPESRVTRVEQSADGFLWCSTPRHLVRFDGVRFVAAPRAEAADGDPPAASAQDTPPGCEPRDVTLLARGTGTVVWALARGGLFSRRDSSWQEVPLPDAVRDGADRLTTLLADEAGALWAGAVHGVYRLEHGRWSDVTDRDGVFPWDVRCVTLDRERNVWIGTSGGLVRLRRKRLQVFRTGHLTGNETITALLAESPTNILVGIAGSGLLAGPPAVLHPMRIGTLSQRITVSSLLRGRDGTLWIGTQGDGLWRWRDEKADRIRSSPESRLSSHGISALLEDRRGILWVGTWDGLMQVNRAGLLTAVEDRKRGGDAQPLPSDMVQALCEDSAGRIWAGFQNSGLICFRPGGPVQRYDVGTSLPGNGVRSLFQDGEGVLWIGTTRGLARWQNAMKHSFTTAEGLVDDAVLQILEDDLGHLWLGTRRGIMRIKKSEFTELAAGRRRVLAARVLGVDAGMLDPECTGRMGARAGRTADGRLWFPTTEGIVTADPREIRTQPAPAAPCIEEVRAARQALYSAPFMNPRPQPDNRRPIPLPRGARDVEFRFTAPLLTAPERVHFKFLLAGHDADWSRAGPERTVRYARLAAGQYDFRVMVRDRDGEWSLPAAILIDVPPFFWETPWSWLVALAAIVTGMVGVVHVLDRRQAARQLRELEQRHAIERERGRIARDIHDDVGAGLTEMAMLSELAQAEARPQGMPSVHLDHIFRRARQLTQSLDEIVWAINPANDSVESLISYVGEFAQEFLGAAGLVCRLDLPIDPPPLTLGATVRHHLCLAVKEALHNIVKHADASEVSLAIRIAGRELSIHIQDNGHGFTGPAAGDVAVGQDGLVNLQTRLHEIGGRLLRESPSGQGTRLVLSVELPTAPATSDRAR